MNKYTFLALGSLVFAYPVVAVPLTDGMVIGIDFGATANDDQFNSYAYNAGTIALTTTSGDIVDDVQFAATNLAVNGSNREIGNSDLATGSDVWGDYTYSNGANQSVTLSFSGLDDGLVYEFFAGQDRDAGAENFDANYLLTTGTTTGVNTFLSDATTNQGYGTIFDITPVDGVITFTITPLDDDDGLEWVGIAAATLTVTDPTPPPAAIDLEVGTSIGIDFGGVDGGSGASNWNDVSGTGSGSFAASAMKNTLGDLVSSVGFSWTAATADSNAPDIISGTPAFPDNALDDALLSYSGQTDGDGGTSDGTFTLTFTGLDDSLYYDITLGQSNESTNGNTDTAWTIGWERLNASPVEVGTSAYVTFSSVTSSTGQIVIRSAPIDGGLDISAISALQLTATDVPPPAPDPLADGFALVFDPTGSSSSVATSGLDYMTQGGSWTASLSGASLYEDNTGGYAYVMDAASSEDFIEVELDNGGLDFSTSDIAITFQMLAARASGTGDKSSTLIGYEGNDEIFRLKYVAHTDNTLSEITVTTGDGDESMGYTPLNAIVQPTLPSGFQDFHIVLSNGQVNFSGSSLTSQGGVAMNSTQTLTHLRWEITGTSTENQGFWLDDLIIRDALPSAPRAVSDRPNVIFVLMDDMGYKDVSCYGATVVDTPNIDSLAAGGLQFSDFHTGSSICSPSRAAFLTGAYPQRAGLPYGISPKRESHWFMGLHPDEITLAEQCRNQGYKTLMIGKWHLGFEDIFSYYNQGFDHYYGCNSNIDHDPEFYDESELIYSTTPQARLSSLYTQRVREYIREHRDRPFFLYYAHQYPHTPYTPGNAFAQSTGNGGGNVGERADSIKEVDWSIGQILTELEANGILENTLVIFSSDNGATSNTYCLPYRGSKFVTWEGGHRVPFILNWKGQITTPAVLDTPVVAMDLFPTVSEIIGEPLPTDRVYDGVSLFPLFDEQPISRVTDEPFYYYNNTNLQAVRKGAWKLHVPRTAEQRPWWDQQAANANYRLYDLDSDPNEANDVSGSNQTVVDELTLLADAIRLELGEYTVPGSEQRATGSLFPEVTIVQNLDDWNDDSYFTDLDPTADPDAARGRGVTEYNASTYGSYANTSLGRGFINGSTLPGGWQFLYASEASGGTEVAMTAGSTVGTQFNTGFAGAASAALIGNASTGTFAINTANTGNGGVLGTDLLVVPDENASSDFVIVRYTVEEQNVSFGYTNATITGSFRDLVGGTSDDSVSVHVFHNNTELFTATGGAGRLSETDGTFDLSDVTVAANDTISFVIGSKGSSEGDEVALRATIVFEAETSPVNGDLALNIKPSALMVNGTATLELHGTPGLSYRVERTTDLSDSESWEVVDEIPVLSTSPNDVHVQSGEDERGFWRIVWEE
ncbi:MAG: sulfatase-like hydrolase/transferase [Opitutaceae bacterium]